jgi:hypothetical protein
MNILPAMMTHHLKICLEKKRDEITNDKGLMKKIAKKLIKIRIDNESAQDDIYDALKFESNNMHE